MPTCHYCNLELFSSAEICEPCLGKFLESRVGYWPKYLIERSISQDEINIIRQDSIVNHLSWASIIELLIDSESSIYNEVNLQKEFWKTFNKSIVDFENLYTKAPLIGFMSLILFSWNGIENCRLDLNKSVKKITDSKPIMNKTENVSTRCGEIVDWLNIMKTLYERMYWSGLMSIYHSHLKGMDIQRKDFLEVLSKASKDMLAVWELKPILISLSINSQYSHAIRIATYSVSGWAATQLSYKHPKTRLALASQNESESVYHAFLNQLPNTSFLSWHELEWTKHLSSIQIDLKHKISKSIEQSGPQRPSANKLRIVEPWAQRLIGHDSTSRALEEWQARERTAKENLDTLCRAANLGSREAMVFKLLQTETALQEIAEELGINVGTVKATKSRILNKIRKVVNS